MRKVKITIALLATIMAAASVARAESDTMGNLAETSDKISSIDMNKNLGEAGSALGAFYSGSKAKGESDSVVAYAEQRNSQRTHNLTEKEICNANPLKIILAGKVPPLDSSSGRTGSEEKNLPVSGGALAAGAVALAIAGRKKSYSEDFATVVNFILSPFTSETNSNPPPANPNYDVGNSGSTVECTGNSCGLP